MKRLILVSTFWMCLLALPALAGAVETYPVDQLRPGMRGVTRTVMQGTQIVEIQTEILGVQKSAMGPGRDLIIGRLIDPRTEKTGAVHGMSGSPLMIDGKLVGALSRRITLFEKDGHCGFTPAADMFDVERRRNTDAVVPWESGRWLSRMDFQNTGFAPASGGFGQTLSVPFPIRGWGGEASRILGPLLDTLPGFVPVAAPTGRVETGKKLPLEAGSPLAVVLVDGDLSIAGTGTLTWTDGKRFMAFGHSMMGLGPTHLPVAPAEIISTIPSFYMPHKISNAGAASGIMTQDRLSAISGTMGSLPEMSPYRIHRTHNGETRPELRGRMARHPILTPMLVAMLLQDCLADEQDVSEDFTLRISGRVLLAGLNPMPLDGIYSGTDAERMKALFDQILPLIQLSRAFPKQVQVEGLELEIESYEKESTWVIQEIQPDRTQVRPGESIRLVARLKNPSGDERLVEQTLRIPEEMSEGSMELRVSGGADLRQEAIRDRMPGRPENPGTLLRAMAVNFESDRMYSQINLNEPGTAAEGFLQAGLPASIALQQAHATSPARSFRRVLAQNSQPMKGVVSGSAQVYLKIIP